MAGFEDVFFGETTELGVLVTERDNEDFTITSAALSVATMADAVFRSALACTVDGRRTYYLETFSAANGYAEDTEYQAQIDVTISCGGQTWVRCYFGTFRVKASLTS